MLGDLKDLGRAWHDRKRTESADVEDAIENHGCRPDPWGGREVNQLSNLAILGIDLEQAALVRLSGVELIVHGNQAEPRAVRFEIGEIGVRRWMRRRIVVCR